MTLRGDNGLFKIARGVNECGIENSVSGGKIGSDPSPSPSPSPSPAPAGCDLSVIDLVCGDAKFFSPSVCRGCAYENEDVLADDGCADSDYEAWCDSTATVV